MYFSVTSIERKGHLIVYQLNQYANFLFFSEGVGLSYTSAWRERDYQIIEMIIQES